MVQRWWWSNAKDLDLDDPDDTSAIELGYMDNRSHEVSFKLDVGQIKTDLDAGVDFSTMYTPGEMIVGVS